ncbi:aromatic ring-hydroxylating oxygenase subunit alpha [Thauera linaloolentis]|uniref:Rieske (2Fe-2S) protein n=1 Tax=Thauera linaloolentis (strain DSM 12138 / JCM 21573 / CCUG 41526 / CIP 105981 / IAM 15112 / NBRC 102519 / 47Lol) TaxID=1123367 RepID=N6Z551_THAL4|nr:SRPBCC family protein [Thauera linaloolentis]ENO87279.1 Rieske (2Fe-2S) protein [Thauera linaloolentis 47Lol = DSM 12138]MCM8566729.1 Rieske 2Fe-2S domain-containing protein [Thauera linaloolentis]
MENVEVYRSLIERMLALVDAGTTDSAEAAYRQPTSVYTDPGLLALEKETIFRDEPQMICFSSDLPGKGSYYTFDDLGTPVLLTRDNDGEVHAFLNACTHRSARLKEGCGKTASLACPYHNWGFDLKGKLRAVWQEQTFGSIEKSLYDLVRLPVEEKYGMIFAGMHPDVSFSIDEILGDMAPVFERWDLGGTAHVNTHEWKIKTNWKLALDTFCEGYHFLALHKHTLGGISIGNTAAFDTFGPDGRNHRLAFPNESMLKLRDKPRLEWGPEIFNDFQLVHFIYPNISLLVSPVSVEFFKLYPGDAPGEHRTIFRSYVRKGGEKGWDGNDPQAHFEFICKVVDEEDYWVSANVMKNLNTGLLGYSTFGRNEPALQNMHKAFLRGVGRTPVEAPLAGKAGAAAVSC